MATNQPAVAHRWLERADPLDRPLQQYVAIHRAAHRAAHCAAADLAVRKRPEHRLGRRARVRSTGSVAGPASAAHGIRCPTSCWSSRIAGAIDLQELEDLRLFTTRFIRQVEALDDVRDVVEAPPDNGEGAATIRRTS
ncbi:hypothetical protein ACFWYA_12260 [Streptomyces sp. NPDC059011]|uniref:hypothetical protein n=1 Tax=unclassified Streptomyces TaxID=2593676 RepID=UPI0036AB9870